MVVSVLPIINIPMLLENLLIAANGLPKVPIGNNIQAKFSPRLHHEPIIVEITAPQYARDPNLHFNI